MNIYIYIKWSTSLTNLNLTRLLVERGQWSVEGDGCQLTSQELYSESCKSIVEIPILIMSL